VDGEPALLAGPSGPSSGSKRPVEGSPPFSFAFARIKKSALTIALTFRIHLLDSSLRLAKNPTKKLLSAYGRKSGAEKSYINAMQEAQTTKYAQDNFQLEFVMLTMVSPF